jgi:hypothetical protein
MNDHILKQLKALEPIFHHPDKFGRTKEALQKHVCEEFFEVGASGNVWARADVINTYVGRYNDPHYQDVWEAKDFKLMQIATDNYLLTYTLIQDNKRVTRRSTIWRFKGDTWQILYHQGTLV